MPPLFESECSSPATRNQPSKTTTHRKRVYFLDPEGNDWEFVQYLSANPAERNEYEVLA